MSQSTEAQGPVGDRGTWFSRRRFVRTGVSGAAALLWLPGSRHSAARSDGQVLRIGVMGPFSGPADATGLSIQQGILMALEDARAEGEVPLLIDGQQRDIEIIWVDSASYPDRAVSNVIDAITRQGVALMIGGWHSDVALAAMDAEVPFHILHFGHLGEATTIADRINRAPGKYQGWFKGWPSPSKFAALYGEPLNYFRTQGLWQPASNRAAVMVENTGYGRNWGAALLASLAEAGFSAEAYDQTTPNQRNFSTLLERYRMQQVSLVAMTTTSAVAAISFVRQFRQQRVKALLLAHGLRWIGNWQEQTGDSADYVISMDSAMPIALWQRWWVRRYIRRFSQSPAIAAAGLHYDYARMIFRVLNSASSLNLDTLIRTIYRSPYRGIWNRYRFTPKPVARTLSANEVVTGEFMQGFFMPMAQIFAGEAKIIWPSRYADQRFRPPPWI